MDQPLKFLIVSSTSRFASKDVWDGMFAALRDNMGHEVWSYPVDQMQAFFSLDLLCHHIHSTAASTRTNFTHVIFVGSTFIPDWVVTSIRRAGVKVIYWSLEDPHAFDQNRRFLDLADHYLTNERAVAKEFKKANYLPTAGAASVCTPPACPLSELDEDAQKILGNDVVFCGNVYPNRQKILEELVEPFKEKNIKFGIMGITRLMENEEESCLRHHILGNFKGVVEHFWFVMAYGYAKFTINIERDPFYEYSEKFSSNRKHEIVGESLNPRAYEVALCGGALQLIDNKRKELFEPGILEPGKHVVVYENAADLVEKVSYYLAHEDERRAIVTAARQHALKNHTYESRARRLIDIINLKEKRVDELKDSIKSRLFKK